MLVEKYIPAHTIRKEVNNCRECPFYHEDNEGNYTIVRCTAIEIKKDIWDQVLPESHWDTGKLISVKCPFRKGE